MTEEENDNAYLTVRQQHKREQVLPTTFDYPTLQSSGTRRGETDPEPIPQVGTRGSLISEIENERNQPQQLGVNCKATELRVKW